MKVTLSQQATSTFTSDPVSQVIGQGSMAPQTPNVPQSIDVENQLQLKLTNEHERLKEAVDHANKALEGSDRSFKYEIHKPTNQVVVSVIDNNTHEVIKEIPSKKLLDVIGNLMELAGVLVDERR